MSSNTPFYVPKLLEKKAWLDWRGSYAGGYGWRHNISLSGIKQVAHHHSVTTPTKNATRDVQTIFNIHKNNGWGGIGYNFIVTSEEVNGFAKTVYVGDLANARAHTPNNKGAHSIRAGYGNNHIIGICVVGSFHTGKLPTTAQLRSLHYLTEELIYRENTRLPQIADSWGKSMHGHQEFDWTQCQTNQPAKWDKLVIETKEPAPPTTKPYKIVKLAAPKQVRTTKLATVWNLDFTKWADAKGIGTLEKGQVITVTEVAEHNLGSRYYIHGKGGVNKVDTENYVNPPIVTPQPDPDEQDKVPEVPPQEDDGKTEGDMKGITDSLARIEATLTAIWNAIKKIFNIKE